MLTDDIDIDIIVDLWQQSFYWKINWPWALCCMLVDPEDWKVAEA